MLGVLFSLFASCSATPATWAVEVPVRDLRKYQTPSRETVVRVRTARVVAADYALLRRDFPQLAALSDVDIDAWLLKNAGYIALPQAMNPSGAELQTPIDIDRDDLRSAQRPEGYRRALVFETGQADGEPSLLDGKGFGAREPGAGINSNGLLPLAEALRELVWENTIARIFAAEGKPFTTVRTYAVFDWGFDVKQPQGFVPAGAVLRQAHTREHWNFNSNLPKGLALEIELVLRKYGITSAGLSDALRRQAQVSYDLINVQGRRLEGGGAAVVDFGTFVRVPAGRAFNRTIAVRENLFNTPRVLENTQGGNREVGVLSAVLDPDAPDFVTGTTFENAVPAELFGTANSVELYPERDLVAQQAALAITAYRDNPRSVAPIRNFVSRLLGSLKLPTSSCEQLLTKR